MADDELLIGPGNLASLDRMLNLPKFVEAPAAFYTGMRPESDRLLAERTLNQLIGRLIAGLEAQPSKSFVLAAFASSLSEFPGFETEDREQMLRYLEEIMDIVGIASSDGLLNRWMYGDQLGTLLEQSKKPSPD